MSLPDAFLDQPALDNRATRYLRDRPCGAWTARTIAEAIRATPPAVESMLAEAVRVGAVVRTSAGPRCPAHYHWAGATPMPEQYPQEVGQGGSEPPREGMAPGECESDPGRGANGAPALATPHQHESPGVGPMGSGQPADAGPTRGHMLLLDGEEDSATVAPVIAPPRRVAVPLLIQTIWSDGTVTARWPGHDDEHTFAPLAPEGARDGQG